MQDTWNRVDAFIAERLVRGDAEVERANERAAAAGLPPIQVSPAQAKLLQLLVRLAGARQVLEIGTLGGYSAMWMALALPIDGRLTTLELDPKHAELARRNIAEAGLAETIEVRMGPALDSLKALAEEGAGPFELVFIDADKRSYPEYFKRSLRLCRKGGLIVLDNVVRGGKVLDASGADPDVEGVRRVYELIAAEPRVTATALQTVGVKGYDGLAIALVVR
ncbi:MAG: O-methyltransferase [Elusimicrobia bacterium]|nr:O-methyltransferase [Elusimicrobiota bacterium]